MKILHTYNKIQIFVNCNDLSVIKFFEIIYLRVFDIINVYKFKFKPYYLYLFIIKNFNLIVNEYVNFSFLVILPHKFQSVEFIYPHFVTAFS